MKKPRRCTVVIGALCALLAAATATSRDLGRETLPAGDGWASQGPGTTGGANANADHVFTIRNRQELVAALAFPDATPKIIYVQGTIDANVDDANQPLACASYAAADPQTGELYSLDAYLAAYDPVSWGTGNLPSGPQEHARVASSANQTARVRIRIGANTTLVGVGGDATILGGWFDIRPSGASNTTPMNVIVRNLTFRDVYDCFPQWDPTDGSSGNWNSLYDAVSIHYGANIWIDHNLLRDDLTADASQPNYFGRLYQVHDGLLDVTDQADLVTASWNRFASHDKVSLIGSSDSATNDAGKLRVTIHHNVYDNVVERAPRVRYGQIHVYNNYYDIENVDDYVYSWGVGKNSAIYAENNYFNTAAAIQPSRLIKRFNGTGIHATGSSVNGTPVDLVAAYNVSNSTQLSTDVGWIPALHLDIDPTDAVPASVPSCAGPIAQSTGPDDLMADGFELACGTP